MAEAGEEKDGRGRTSVRAGQEQGTARAGEEAGKNQERQECKGAQLEIISGSISLSSSHPVISSRELCFAVIAKVTSGLLISPSSK